MINRGPVSVIAPPTVPSMVDAPFFEALTTILNVEVASRENPFTTFRPAPTNFDLAIHGMPLYELLNQECLEEILPSAFKLAVGFTLASVWVLNTDETSHSSKATTSVTGSVTVEFAATIGTTICLFFHPRHCHVIWRESTTTQCRNCCKLSHATQGGRSPIACSLSTLSTNTETTAAQLPHARAP